ncbi:MAG: septum site-determining protein MinC [Desulfobulbaceae bacterium]|nr:septum site-determining protein MinC [Desulfobulbaceae bacterium]
MSKQHSTLVELKGSAFTLPVIHLRTFDLVGIKTELNERLSQSVSFFAHAPVVIDLGELKDTTLSCDFTKLKQLLRDVKLIPIGVYQCPEILHPEAIKAELAILKNGVSNKKNGSNTKSTIKQTSTNKVQVKIIDKPVRSGQQIYAPNGDLVILSPVNAGAEVIADGNIYIYAPLRGRALAGVMGDTTARIFTLSMEAQLISIAGHYRLFDEDPPVKVYTNSAQAYLEDKHIIVTQIP